MLADGWVADVDSGFLGDDEQAIACGAEAILTMFHAPYEGPELLTVFSGTSLTEDDETCGLPVVDDGERRLALVVFEHEFRRGGGTAPRLADRAAPADVLCRQQDQYLVHDDLLGKVVQHGDTCLPVRHGAPSDPAARTFFSPNHLSIGFYYQG